MLVRAPGLLDTSVVELAESQALSHGVREGKSLHQAHQSDEKFEDWNLIFFFEG